MNWSVVGGVKTTGIWTLWPGGITGPWWGTRRRAGRPRQASAAAGVGFRTAGSAVRWIGALATLASVTNFGTARPGGTKPKSRVGRIHRHPGRNRGPAQAHQRLATGAAAAELHREVGLVLRRGGDQRRVLHRDRGRLAVLQGEHRIGAGMLANSSGSVPFSAPMVTVTSIPEQLVIASDWVAVVFTTTLPKSICWGISATLSLIPMPLRSISTVGTIEESVVSVIFAACRPW